MDVLKFSSKLIIAWFLLFFAIINLSFSARTLNDPSSSPPNPHHHHHHIHHSLTFYMLNALSDSSPRPVTTKVNGQQLPFPKPLGLFPPDTGIPLPNPNPTVPDTGFATQTLSDDIPGIGISFPARATLEELEFGAVTVIDEALFNSTFGSILIGKAQGVYVTSSENGSSYMVAMTACFANSEYRDGLRFFGVHRTDVSESHVAVIGGTGKYHNANGYATIKTVNISSNTGLKENEGAYKVLSFNVYLG